MEGSKDGKANKENKSGGRKGLKAVGEIKWEGKSNIGVTEWREEDWNGSWKGVKFKVRKEERTYE